MITKKKQSFIYRRITSTGAAEFLAASNLAVKEQRITSAITCQLNVILDRDPVFVQQFFLKVFFFRLTDLLIYKAERNTGPETGICSISFGLDT